MNVLCSSENSLFRFSNTVKQLVHRTSKYPSYKYLALVSVLVLFLVDWYWADIFNIWYWYWTRIGLVLF